MNFERFSQLWDALVTNRPKAAAAVQITNGMTAKTAQALIEYASGNKSKVEAVRARLIPKPL